MKRNPGELQALQNQAWESRRAGKYSEAIELYSQCYESSAEPNYLYQRGRTHLEVENYAAALEDMRKVVTLTASECLADGYFIYQGICLWCLSQYSQVLPVWEKGLNAPYTDASGGVALMMYGAKRLSDSHYQELAIRLLHKHMLRDLNRWPGIIAPYLLGRVNEESLSAAVATTSSKIIQSRRRCQADFYIALLSLCKGDWKRFKDSMNRCVGNPYGYHEYEYYLARWERNNEFPEFVGRVTAS